MSDQPDDPADAQAFELLDSYLAALHAGSAPDRRQFLARHPELAAALDCLDAIASLAPAPTEHLDGRARVVQSAPTQIVTDAIAMAAPARDSSPGAAVRSDFGDYELLAELGRGGMGVVYKARQKSLDRLVAIKMILASHLATNDQVARFYAEAKAAAKLQHPHVVGIHEVGQLHGQHYFVMEHVEGQSLAVRLASGPIEPTAAAELVATIARAVNHLHAQGIVHRDLKPSNILIDSRGQPHVTDFGLAKVLMTDSGATHSGAIVGTPSYMAPEQAAARGSQVGPRSDVYSLGAVLYELLTGRPPFREATPLDTLVQVLEAEPRLPREFNSNVSRDLEMICLRCLEKSPEARYTTALALAEDLERLLKGESVDARPPGILQRLRRWSRRKPALASHVGMLALCAVIVQANYSMTQSVDPVTHLRVIGVLAGWAVICLACQHLLSFDRIAERARYVWAAADVMLFTAVVMITRDLEGPVVGVFPGLVAASGLWFRERLVWFMCALSIVAYLWLMLFLTLVGPPLREPLFRHIILLVVLVVLGVVVAYQVKRIRALSRYYEHRQLP